MFTLKGKEILLLDIETDSLEIDTAKVKWFGAYSYKYDKYYEIPYGMEKGQNYQNGETKNLTGLDRIKILIEHHKHIVSFNGKEFDIPILENNLNFEMMKNQIDLYLICKQRLAFMGFTKIKEYSLEAINRELKLCEESKGKIDYKIFQKDDWTEEEIQEIKKYLRQDINITKALFEYFNSIFESIVPMLSFKDQQNMVHIKASPASLSYRAILNNAGIIYEFEDIMQDNKVKRQTFEGAHHIETRQLKAKGNIVSLDFTSMYPHIIMMCNLLTQKQGGWKGNGFIKLEGEYNNTNLGKIESSLKKILLERLEAKKNGNTPKNLAFKVLINAFYGTLGNSCFKTIYNPIAAGDCTKVARTLLKRLAQTLEVNGFTALYGFTDNVIVEIPEESSKEELMFVADNFIKDIQKEVPFPQDTFKLEMDKEMKFIWFVAKNCYLFVDTKDKIQATSTLLNKNSPEVIMNLYNNYICPKIIKELDVNFTENELRTELLKIIENNIEITAEEFTVQYLEKYKVKSSLQYQISEKYGVGKHVLIPNIAGIGVGKSKSTKNHIGVRYCTIQEFKGNNLDISSIHIEQIMKHIKPFYKKQEITLDTFNEDVTPTVTSVTK